VGFAYLIRGWKEENNSILAEVPSQYTHSLGHLPCRLLHCKKYELGGKLASWSVFEGGLGTKCLSQERFSVMSNLQVKYEDAIAAVKMKNLKLFLLTSNPVQVVPSLLPF